MSSTPPPDPSPELPAVDERLVAPGTRYEIEDGRVAYVPPCDEPHGTSHVTLAALVYAHRAAGYTVAADMLTRTSRIDDIAPDVSVFRSARDPDTGGRCLEELAFEVASTESLGHAATRAAKLVARGVRRVFAIALDRERVVEWSSGVREWSILDRASVIEDPALGAPLPVEAMLDAARADDAIARALRLKRHPEFVAEHLAGKAQALLLVLASRGLAISDTERREILDEHGTERMDRWLSGASSCTSVAELLALK